MTDTTSATSFDAAAYTSQGTPRERVGLPGATFDGTVNVPVMHQAVKAFLSNQRQGTHATKTRGFVVGGNQKPWKQKGTGRARQGSIRAPNWVGGGTVFGPTPHRYTEIVPRQVRALARKSAFNARAREGSLIVIDAFAYEVPKTSTLQQLLARLDVATRKVLILTDGVKRNVYLSGRNLPLVQVLPFSDVSTYHLLWSDVVLVESGALGTALEPIAEKTLSRVKVKKTAKAVKAAKTEGTKHAAKSEKAPAAKAKASAKKAPAKGQGKKTAAKAPAKKSAKKPAVKKAPAKKAAPKKKGK